MKLKKKARIIIVVLIVLILCAVGAIAVIKFYPSKKPENSEVKVLKSIEAYEYHLKENKDKKYKEMFKELEKILREDEVSDESYVKKLAEMFIYDFYSLNDKLAKTDVGGVDFVHKNALQNFLLDAEDTYYKYVESNLYGERKQNLPMVDKVIIESATPIEFGYNGQQYPGYEVKASWTYTSEDFNHYQKAATLKFLKEDIKLYLVELQ